jgi:5-methylcytosine-specific restriction endonuclease McrA
MEDKRCETCGIRKPLIDYYYVEGQGYQRSCIVCREKYAHRWKLARDRRLGLIPPRKKCPPKPPKKWHELTDEQRAARYEAVKRFRQKNKERVAVMDRMGKRMLRAYPIRVAWPVICAYYGGKCLRCGKKGKHLCIDHVVPLPIGPNELVNTQPLCRSCNVSKRKRDTDFRPDHGNFIKQLVEINPVLVLGDPHGKAFRYPKITGLMLPSSEAVAHAQ